MPVVWKFSSTFSNYWLLRYACYQNIKKVCLKSLFKKISFCSLVTAWFYDTQNQMSVVIMCIIYSPLITYFQCFFCNISNILVLVWLDHSVRIVRSIWPRIFYVYKLLTKYKNPIIFQLCLVFNLSLMSNESYKCQILDHKGSI